MNVCEVYEMREGMEHQCITEDSKARVYLSVVRKIDHKDIERWNAKKEIIRKRKKRAVIRECLLMAGQLLKLATSAAVGYWITGRLQNYLTIIRGSREMGSEFIIGAIVAVLFFFWIDWVIGGNK